MTLFHGSIHLSLDNKASKWARHRLQILQQEIQTYSWPSLIFESASGKAVDWVNQEVRNRLLPLIQEDDPTAAAVIAPFGSWSGAGLHGSGPKLIQYDDTDGVSKNWFIGPDADDKVRVAAAAQPLT